LQAAATFSAMIAAPPLPWAQEKSKLTITAIRLVKTKPKRPYPNYKPDPNSWSTQGVEVSAPLNIYLEYKPTRSLFAAKGEMRRHDTYLPFARTYATKRVIRKLPDRRK
jgi:hypothetical protein